MLSGLFTCFKSNSYSNQTWLFKAREDLNIHHLCGHRDCQHHLDTSWHIQKQFCYFNQNPNGLKTVKRTACLACSRIQLQFAVCGMDEFKEYLSMRKHLLPKKQHVIITINTIKNGLLNN